MSYNKSDTKLAEYLKPQSEDMRVRGITGTNFSAGTISGKEKNPQLTGRFWADEVEDMLATDPIIKRSWYLLKQTLLSAKWKWKPGIEGDATSEELARFANEAFGFDGYSGMMEATWEEQLSYLLEFLPLGYRYAEELYYTGNDSIGRPKVWLRVFADREPTAHNQWLSRDKQQLDGVMQNMIGQITPDPIPASKMILLTLNRTGSNFEGVGLLRPVWWWWKQKQRTASLLSVGIERWVIPTPKITVVRENAEQTGASDGEVQAMIDAAEIQARAYIAQEQGYLIENSIVKFETFGGDAGFDPSKALSVIQECDNQISQAFMAQFMNLGITDSGSRAVGEIHLSVFRRACINYLDLIASALSGQDRRCGGTMARLINWNYGEVEATKLPKLIHEGLDNDALTDSLASLPSLVQSQLITPDDSLEQSIRQRIGAGDIPEQAKRSSQDRALAGGNQTLAFAERLRKLNEDN